MIELEAAKRLSRDLARASATLGKDEARFLTDTHFQIKKV